MYNQARKTTYTLHLRSLVITKDNFMK